MRILKLMNKEDGLALGLQQWCKAFDHAKKLAGLRKNVVFHILRHAYVGRLVMAGMDIRTVQEFWQVNKNITMTTHCASARLDAEVNANLMTVGFDMASVLAVSASA